MNKRLLPSVHCGCAAVHSVLIWKSIMLVQVAEFVMKAEIEGSNKFRLRELPGDEPYL